MDGADSGLHGYSMGDIECCLIGGITCPAKFKTKSNEFIETESILFYSNKQKSSYLESQVPQPLVLVPLKSFLAMMQKVYLVSSEVAQKEKCLEKKQSMLQNRNQANITQCWLHSFRMKIQKSQKEHISTSHIMMVYMGWRYK